MTVDLEFLIQKEGDFAWLPLESLTVEILVGRYQLIAQASEANCPVQVHIQHQYVQDGIWQEEVQQQLLRTDSQGRIEVLPPTFLQHGHWIISCTPAEYGQPKNSAVETHCIQLQVLDQEADLDQDWEFLDTPLTPVSNFSELDLEASLLSPLQPADITSKTAWNNLTPAISPDLSLADITSEDLPISADTSALADTTSEDLTISAETSALEDIILDLDFEQRPVVTARNQAHIELNLNPPDPSTTESIELNTTSLDLTSVDSIDLDTPSLDLNSAENIEVDTFSLDCDAAENMEVNTTSLDFNAAENIEINTYLLDPSPAARVELNTNLLDHDPAETIEVNTHSLDPSPLSTNLPNLSSAESNTSEPSLPELPVLPKETPPIRLQISPGLILPPELYNPEREENELPAPQLPVFPHLDNWQKLSYQELSIALGRLHWSKLDTYGETIELDFESLALQERFLKTLNGLALKEEVLASVTHQSITPLPDHPNPTQDTPAKVPDLVPSTVKGES